MEKDRKKALAQEYKEMKKYYGVIQIKNEKNGKIFIDTVANTKNRWIVYQMSLKSNRLINKELQKEWNEFGAEAFTYTILWEKDSSQIKDMKYELKKLKKEWLLKLEPFDDKGYHKPL
ncbi:GIY-YIG nuclease family protein [Carnobacterium gallinarum]|uniref:GIY-YIG nuclease family protein n=1 Tax=Carnobacterium gallinarum TaxID=2749 RepID=UPI00054E508B|nr:GIY-YIG nuclease family protein [Carnobacterium gallinarum]